MAEDVLNTLRYMREKRKALKKKPKQKVNINITVENDEAEAEEPKEGLDINKLSFPSPSA